MNNSNKLTMKICDMGAKHVKFHIDIYSLKHGNGVKLWITIWKIKVLRTHTSGNHAYKWIAV